MQKAVASALNWRRAFMALGALILVLMALWFAEHIPRTITIFAIAAFIAFGAQPLVKRLEERRVPRPLGITIVFSALLVIIIVGLVLIVPLTIEQTQVLADNAPASVATAQSWMTGAESWLREKFPSLAISSNAFDIGQLSGERLSVFMSTTVSSVGTIVVNTATAFFIGFSALILSFFFLLNDKPIADGFVGMFPERRRETARALSVEVTQLFGSYISGQLIVCAITGIVITIASALLGFKFSLILGIISAVAYAIPIFGMLVAQLIAIVLCAPQGPWMVIWVQVIMFAMARISDSVLVPKIMGTSVGVSPIGVMFAVFAGGELFGLPGLLLGIPAAALIKILWRYFAAPWIHRQLDGE